MGESLLNTEIMRELLNWWIGCATEVECFLSEDWVE